MTSSRQRQKHGCAARALTPQQKRTLQIIKETTVYVETSPSGRKTAINIRNDKLDLRSINALIRKEICFLQDDGWVPGARSMVVSA